MGKKYVKLRKCFSTCPYELQLEPEIAPRQKYIYKKKCGLVLSMFGLVTAPSHFY